MKYTDEIVEGSNGLGYAFAEIKNKNGSIAGSKVGMTKANI